MDIQVFAPEWTRQKLSYTPEKLINDLVGIKYEDVPKVVKFWKTKQGREEIISIAEVLGEKNVTRGTFEPFTRRPHITVHGSSKPGTDDVAKLLNRTTKHIAYVVANAGYNYWYGGGDTGMMGIGADYFIEAREKSPKTDQYVIQVIPSDFAVGVKSKNGMKAANEGISRKTDVAIIIPDFVDRRDLLNRTCTLAVSAPGGSGTADEITDIHVHAKTGLEDSGRVILINLYMNELQMCYFDPYIKTLMNNAIGVGLESKHSPGVLSVINTHAPDTNDCMAYNRDWPQELAQMIKSSKPNPSKVYAGRMRHLDLRKTWVENAQNIVVPFTAAPKTPGQNKTNNCPYCPKR